MDIPSPSANGSNGTSPPDRALGGRFAPGNKGGPGNPYAKQVAVLRSAMLEAVTPEDMTAIVAKLVELAKSGSIPAAKEVLERCLGKPQEADLIERLEELERLLAPEEAKR